MTYSVAGWRCCVRFSTLRPGAWLFNPAALSLVVGLLLTGVPLCVRSQQFQYATNGNGTATITQYLGPGGCVTIPSSLDGLTVTGIGYRAFLTNQDITSVFVPATVTNLAESAFYNCNNLSEAFFWGDLPEVIQVDDNPVFDQWLAPLLYCLTEHAGSWVGRGGGGLTGSEVGCDWVDFFYNAAPTLGPATLTVKFSAPNVDSEGKTIIAWLWHFGDGATSTAQNPSHTYAVAGTYRATLNATNQYYWTNYSPYAHTVLAQDSLYTAGPWVTVTNAQAVFEMSEIQGAGPLTVAFTATNVDSVGNVLTAWFWDFDDGSTSAIRNPTHTYLNAGTYNPKLYATNALGGTVLGVSSGAITVTNTLVAFTADSSGGTAPLTVHFTAPAIDSAGNPITAWFWDFDDGGTSRIQNPSHTYTTSGDFNPTLYATNALGGTVAGVEPGDIEVDLPTLTFTATPLRGMAPLTVHFSAPSADDSSNRITAWQWEFGDGASSTEQNPVHTFATPGTYGPELSVTNVLGVAVFAYGPGSWIMATNLVANGGFETYNFSGQPPFPDWTLSGPDLHDGHSGISITGENGITPHSGSEYASLESYGTLSYLSQTIATTPGTLYSISLWLTDPTGQTPNEFHIAWNGNPLFDQTNLAAFGWTNLCFTVPATSAATVLEFAWRAEGSVFGLDDVTVIPASAPTDGINISRIAVSGEDVRVDGINGTAGATCYLLSSDQLTAPLAQWNCLATNVLQTNGAFSVTASNAISHTPIGRYFRLEVK